MNHEEKSPYSFIRKNCSYTDTLSRDGKGAQVKSGIGLIWSGFRPSDDSCLYGYLIPSNMFASVVLDYMAEFLEKDFQDPQMAKEAKELQAEIQEGIRKYGIVEDETFGKIYAYETDGLGNYNLMDDANVPSLLAMPYLGDVDVNDPIYQNTRNFVWSEDNPYFFKGKAGEGIGGPHIGFNYIWPMSLIMRATTSNDEKEIRYCIETLRDTDGGTGFMHESFHKDNPSDYTRSWFAWTNTLFGELIVKLQSEGKLKDLLG